MIQKDKFGLPNNFGEPGGPRFLDVLNQHIGAKLQVFQGKPLNKENMEAMYQSVSETIHGLFMRSGRNIHEDARCWLAQQLYECIKISDSAIVTRDVETWKYTPTAVYQKCTLSKVPLDDLRFIAGLFSDASFNFKILEELKARRA